MPTWQPNRTDVVFDHGGAALAAAAAEALAAALRRSIEQRNHLGAEARTDWEGPARESFGSELARLSMEAHQVEMTLRALSRALTRASVDAAPVQNG